jgi:hypothetical protein
MIQRYTNSALTAAVLSNTIQNVQPTFLRGRSLHVVTLESLPAKKELEHAT